MREVPLYAPSPSPSLIRNRLSIKTASQSNVSPRSPNTPSPTRSNPNGCASRFGSSAPRLWVVARSPSLIEKQREFFWDNHTSLQRRTKQKGLLRVCTTNGTWSPLRGLRCNVTKLSRPLILLEGVILFACLDSCGTWACFRNNMRLCLGSCGPDREGWEVRPGRNRSVTTIQCEARIVSNSKSITSNSTNMK